MFKKFIIGFVAVLLAVAFQSCQKVITFDVCFTVKPQPATMDQSVTFTNCSQGNKINYWYFGDGGIDSVDISPTHIYTIPGSYAVGLLIIDKYNDTMSNTQNIFVNPLANTYAGTFSGSEVCTMSGTSSNNITVANVTDTIVTIYNLYNTGQTFTAHTNGLTGTIVPQIFNNGNGNEGLSGTFQLSGDTATGIFNVMTLNVIVSSVSYRDNCTATLYKQ